MLVELSSLIWAPAWHAVCQMVVQCPAKRSAIFARQKDCSPVPELTFRWMSVCLCVSRSRSPKDSRAGWARRGRSSYLTEAVLRAEKCCFSPFLRWLSWVRGFKGRGHDFKGAPTALAVLTRSCLKLQHHKALDFRAWACGGLGKKKEGEEKKVDFFFFFTGWDSQTGEMGQIDHLQKAHFV